MSHQSISSPRAGLRSLWNWFDTQVTDNPAQHEHDKGIDWLRTIPFIGMHLGCLAVVWVGWSPVAVVVAALLYMLRMFAITGFYHRYFSHRAFKTSRAAQFVFALLGASAVQRGPLWWASQHRHHHINSDQESDAHSPAHKGLMWSHLGWFLSRAYFATRHELVRDFNPYPELRFLDRFDIFVPLLLAVCLFGIGELLASVAPALQTSGAQMLVWGFFISTVVLYHATFTINSVAHRLGSRPFATRDDSRNNAWLALLTFGEGWHNNHHFYPGSARQGFRWWEIDFTYYGLRLLAAMGIIWALKPVPAHVERARQHSLNTGARP